MKTESKISIEENGIEYPCLMWDERDGRVLLFIRRGAGIVIHNPKNANHIGVYYETWVMSLFKPYHGTITLSND